MSRAWLWLWIVGLGLACGMARAATEPAYAPISPELRRHLQAAAPAVNGELGKLQCTDLPNQGFLVVAAHEADGHEGFYAQILVRTALPDTTKEGFDEVCRGYPAKRVTNRWVWVLVGHVELRISARAARFRHDSALDGIVSAFNLKALAQLAAP